MSKPRIKIPKTVSKGEVFEVKFLLTHRMESGRRKDASSGEAIPRMIVNKFTASYNGKEVLAADWHIGIAENPYMSFYVKAQDSGDLTLSWIDDEGTSIVETRRVEVN